MEILAYLPAERSAAGERMEKFLSASVGRP